MTDWQIAIETSSRSGSIALLRRDVLVKTIKLPPEERTAQTLAPALSDLMEVLRDKNGSLAFVAVSHGPGSFTGLRIGVTAAKTLAYALNIPVVPCDTLRVLLHQAQKIAPNRPRYDASVHAYRGQVFWRQQDQQGNTLVPSQAIDRSRWLEFLQRIDSEGQSFSLSPDSFSFVAIGDAWSQVLQAPPHIELLPKLSWVPEAASVGELAWQSFTSKGGISPFNLSPQYLRESAAVEKQQLEKGTS
jgi:tRNA threonylcarbamoyladenosine biosynthesis protein TsaB